MRTEIMKIDSNIASEFLSLGGKNRKLTKHIVDKYASDMIHGNWILNGESIKVATKSGKPIRLLDGQHRLTAVINIGKTISMGVVFIPIEEQNPGKIFETLDQGKQRDIIDILTTLELGIDGFSNRVVSGVLTGYAQMLRISKKEDYLCNSKKARIDFLQQNPNLIAFGCKMKEMSNESGLRRLSGPALGATMQCWELNQEDAEEFFSSVCSGQLLVKGDPGYELRNTLLMGTPIAPSSAKAVDLYLMTIRAWNFFCRHEQVFGLRAGKDVKPLPGRNFRVLPG